MHIPRMDGLSNRDSKIANAVIVPIAGDFGLPVWAIFLLIYPPICAILFAITCRIFRKRWWSAAESV